MTDAYGSLHFSASRLLTSAHSGAILPLVKAMALNEYLTLWHPAAFGDFWKKRTP